MLHESSLPPPPNNKTQNATCHIFFVINLGAILRARGLAGGGKARGLGGWGGSHTATLFFLYFFFCEEFSVLSKTGRRKAARGGGVWGNSYIPRPANFAASTTVRRGYTGSLLEKARRYLVVCRSHAGAWSWRGASSTLLKLLS